MEMNVLLNGPVFSFGGYGVTARGLIDGLTDEGHEVRIKHFDDYRPSESITNRSKYEDLHINRSPMRPDVNLILASMGFNKTFLPTVVHTGWEVDRLPEKIVEDLKNVDVVTVWSKEIAPVYAKHHDNVKVVPIGVDTNKFRPLEKSNDVFTFVVNGKWEYRKNFKNLVKAFNGAFKNEKDVKLVIKTVPFGASPQEIVDALRSIDSTGRVEVDFNDYTTEDLAQFYNRGDVYVHPTRAEGFGIPMLEAMSCGLPLITSKVGGQREFANDKNSLLVGGKLKKTIPHGGYPPGTRMFEPDVMDLQAKMRYVFDNQSEVDRLSKASRETALNYDWTIVTKQMISVLEEVIE